MKNFIFFFIIIFSTQYTDAICQIGFGSNYIEAIYEKLPIDCKKKNSGNISTNKYSIITNSIIPFKTVTVNKYIKDNIIEDVGISIFDSTSRSFIKPNYLWLFLERKILELFLLKDNLSLKKKLRENKIHFLLNGNSVVNRKMLEKAFFLMIDKTVFNIKKDSLHYEMNWSNTNNKDVLFSFPANNNLVRAKDKKELDEELIWQLKDFHFEWKGSDKFNISEISKNDLILKKNIYTKIGKTYFINNINSNSYFSIKNKELQYIFDQRYPIESLCNLVQYPLINKKKELNLVHKVYGKKEFTYNLTINDFFGYFKNNSEFYTGIEKNDKDSIKAIVIINNKYLNFIHLLILDFGKDDLFNSNKSISATFLTNIPVDNIDNLFGEYVPNKKRMKVHIK